MNFLVIGKMKIIGYIIFFALFLIISCRPQCSETILTVRNESGVDIKIIAYNKANASLDSLVFKIKNNEQLAKKFEHCPAGKAAFSIFRSDFFKSDSIKVILNGSKKLIFEAVIFCDQQNIKLQRNPLYQCIYNSGTIGTFIFTKEDYENAEDCNGNCE